MADWPYYTEKWLKLRKSMLRKHPLCRMCKERGLVRRANEVDHIKPVKEGGEPFDPDNLQCLCKSCHSRKTRADMTGVPMRGCNANGMPTDQNHWWNAEKISQG